MSRILGANRTPDLIIRLFGPVGKLMYGCWKQVSPTEVQILTQTHRINMNKHSSNLETSVQLSGSFLFGENSNRDISTYTTFFCPTNSMAGTALLITCCRKPCRSDGSQSCESETGLQSWGQNSGVYVSEVGNLDMTIFYPTRFQFRMAAQNKFGHSAGECPVIWAPQKRWNNATSLGPQQDSCRWTSNGSVLFLLPIALSFMRNVGDLLNFNVGNHQPACRMCSLPFGQEALLSLYSSAKGDSVVVWYPQSYVTFRASFSRPLTLGQERHHWINQDLQLSLLHKLAKLLNHWTSLNKPNKQNFIGANDSAFNSVINCQATTRLSIMASVDVDTVEPFHSNQYFIVCHNKGLR